MKTPGLQEGDTERERTSDPVFSRKGNAGEGERGFAPPPRWICRAGGEKSVEGQAEGWWEGCEVSPRRHDVGSDRAISSLIFIFLSVHTSGHLDLIPPQELEDPARLNPFPSLPRRRLHTRSQAAKSSERVFQPLPSLPHLPGDEGGGDDSPL